ncbi:MerR family transcriptional regulator [Priestia megaterium]
MNRKVKEVADLIGISVRTLHHYDEIGLLKPDAVSESGYRLYSPANLDMLQQILFFKELGFSLKQIHEIITDPTFNRTEALILQKNMLIEKRSRLDQMIVTINKTIQYEEGAIEMNEKERFKGLDFSHNPYEEEARKRWGNQRVDEANEKVQSFSPEEQQHMSNQWESIYTHLASLRDLSPSSIEAQKAIATWYQFSNENFGTYSLEAFKGLGEMYVQDERFTTNIDRYGKGLAKFMSEAMSVFADAKNNKQKD